ncbi:unnamed protein product [Schistocephalus solidus]|uniref:Uncharacterized protein n=1 Tax=Schistocephalus solidus TaxID=70667 RepID=A0A183TK88_SCHSO|nr:unnamed protein product [Schistocephalus solidus]
MYVSAGFHLLFLIVALSLYTSNFIFYHYRVTTSKPKSNAQLNGVPSSTPSSTGATPVAGAETKLRDLETQLQQEQAIRRQQNDYIRQLQKYYDNLLAKHALAEVTIDQLRFVSKVGNSSENDPISRRSGSRSTLSDAILTGSDALHPRPLDNYFKTPTASDSVRRQQHVKSSSVSLLSPCSFPVAPSHVQAGLRRSGLRIDSESLDAAARQDISPRKFMLAPRRPQLLSASTDQLLCQQHLSSEDKRPGRSTDLHFTSANGTASGFESLDCKVVVPPIADRTSAAHAILPVITPSLAYPATLLIF